MDGMPKTVRRLAGQGTKRQVERKAESEEGQAVKVIQMMVTSRRMKPRRGRKKLTADRQVDFGGEWTHTSLHAGVIG